MEFKLKPAVLTSYLRMGISTYRAKLLVNASFWGAAILVGLASVYFAKLITTVQDGYTSHFHAHPIVMSLLTPFTFVVAVAVVKLLEPHAAGSGVPQVLHANILSKQSHELAVKSDLVSVRTAAVKVFSTAIGFLGGASIGGEGPTVQISGSIFATIGNFMKKDYPKLDFTSYITAAAGAGIAAAFNTPLGGIAFALEEFTIGDFGPLKHMVMIAVIVAGLAAQSLAGNELYFGNPVIGDYQVSFVGWAIVIGVVGGIMGGLFGKIVASIRIEKLRITWWMRALVCGIIVAVINALFLGATGGSGYAVTRIFLDGKVESLPLLFPVAKLIATALSTLSGMGGGILAPSLSIGAWMGIATGKIALFANLRVCALLGMVAYFTGAFQIPMTAVIVVMEMTDEHMVVFPMMIAAVAAYVVARIIMPVPLYHLLIERSERKKTLAD